MYILFKIIDGLFPLITFFILMFGIKRNAIYFIIAALWMSIISLIIHFQSSGNQFLGSYFDYVNAAIYSANLIILFLAVFFIIAHLEVDSTIYRFSASLLKAFLVIGSVFVMINLWTNAFFIDDRMPGTPVMQVAMFQKVDYCSYKYLFYKVAKNGSVYYLCPNHYGLIPSIGRLVISPDFIARQFSVPKVEKKKFGLNP